MPRFQIPNDNDDDYDDSYNGGGKRGPAAMRSSNDGGGNGGGYGNGGGGGGVESSRFSLNSMSSSLPMSSPSFLGGGTASPNNSNFSMSSPPLQYPAAGNFSSGSSGGSSKSNLKSGMRMPIYSSSNTNTNTPGSMYQNNTQNYTTTTTTTNNNNNNQPPPQQPGLFVSPSSMAPGNQRMATRTPGRKVIPAATAVTMTTTTTTTPNFTSNETPKQGRVFTRNESGRMGQQQSVRWTCRSPDGLSLHSIIQKQQSSSYQIVSNRLPIPDVNDMNMNSPAARPENSKSYRASTAFPVCIRTKLPAFVQDALQVDPPVELLCVLPQSNGTRAEPSNDLQQQQQQRLKNLPLLCLYTRKSVFLLQLAYSSNPNTMAPQEEVEGKVVSVSEPFERHLLSSSSSSFSTTICRVRPAPYPCSLPQESRLTFQANQTPSCALAMLTTDVETGQYTLWLHHVNGKITKPLQFGVEQLAGEQQDRYVDFQFAAASNDNSQYDYNNNNDVNSSTRSLSAFISLSILLLKRSGDVCVATPIVLEGTVLPRMAIEDALHYLDSQMLDGDRSTARWRQCRAAQQYLFDVFPIADKRQHFVAAKVFQHGVVGSNEHFAGAWPVQLQGPVVFNTVTEPIGPPAITIESLVRGTAGNGIVPFAIGKGIVGNSVDFGVASVTSLIPRFAFESRNDGHDINDAICKLGAIVERVDLDERKGNDNTNDSGINEQLAIYQNTDLNTTVSLVQDAVVDSLLHVTRTNGICTISTNIMRTTSRRLSGLPAQQSRPTTAWNCLSTSGAASSNNNVTIQGIVLTAEDHLLIARLSDGSLVPVNITESQLVHEMEFVEESSDEQKQRLITAAGSHSAAEIARMEATPPFYELIEPLVKRIQTGLGGMSKLVGSETGYKDITPEMLAVGIDVKKHCDKNVVEPLLELQKMVQARREMLMSMATRQRDQVAQLQQSISDLQARCSSMEAKMQAAESNATLLSEKSQTIFQASQDLLPTITQAEHDWFQFLKRFEKQTAAWEDKAKRLTEVLNEKRKAMMSAAPGSFAPMGMQRSSIEKLHRLLEAEERVLNRTSKDLNDASTKLESTARKAGLHASENKPANIPS